MSSNSFGDFLCGSYLVSHTSCSINHEYKRNTATDSQQIIDVCFIQNSTKLFKHVYVLVWFLFPAVTG